MNAVVGLENVSNVSLIVMNPPLARNLPDLSSKSMNALVILLKARLLAASENLFPGTTDLQIERCVVFTVVLSGKDSKSLNKLASLFSQLP